MRDRCDLLEHVQAAVQRSSSESLQLFISFLLEGVEEGLVLVGHRRVDFLLCSYGNLLRFIVFRLLDVEVAVHPVRLVGPVRHVIEGTRERDEQVVSHSLRDRVLGVVRREQRPQDECGSVDRLPDRQALVDEPRGFDHPPEPQ